MSEDPPPAADTAALLREARAGRTEALGALFERYRNYLQLVARLHSGGRLQGKFSASDVVQETFLQAQRAFEGFRGETEAEFESWLYRILSSRLSKEVRRYVGTARRDVRKERALDGIGRASASSQALVEMVASPRTSPSVGATRREQAMRLARALTRLPDDYREVLVLRYFEGCTFPGVATRMGRSLDSVEKLWTRALARLRGLVGEL